MRCGVLDAIAVHAEALVHRRGGIGREPRQAPHAGRMQRFHVVDVYIDMAPAKVSGNAFGDSAGLAACLQFFTKRRRLRP
jgi:hypothetical protein